MDKKDLIKQLKQYILERIEVEYFEDKRIINGCDLSELLDQLEKDVMQSLESKNKIEVYW